ncbi:MAG: fibrobacter succinogenes major paralogous domain-containing protein [Fibromonadaceae bacterium]|jgi:uncharacterized protein (TIGR02145 family)|nr:fibrobacter succinogenes major paralogous domain-containing protein [Fibromonadaceae bacterium]
MRSPLSKLAFSASITLALALTLSCSDDSGGNTTPSYKYCIKDNICLEGPFTVNNCLDGQLSNSCPDGSSQSGGGSSSSRDNVGSSSSGGNASVSSSSVAATSGTFQDSRDYKTYKWVKIGTQTWMAENLNYDVPSNDTDLCYNNEPANCTTYGRLYNWSTAMNNDASSTASPSSVRGACPSGWHLPSDAEWETLVTAASGSLTAGTILKADSPLWNDNGKGTDSLGFSALPAGYAQSNGYFSGVGNNGFWWSSTEASASNAYIRYMNNAFAGVSMVDIDKSRLYSVRCVKD